MHIPTEFTALPEMVEASPEQQRARERVRDLQPVFVPHQVNEINHTAKTAKKAAKARKAAKVARKKNRPIKKAKKGKKK